MKRIALALILCTALHSAAFATVPSDSSTIAGPYDCDGADTTFTIPSTLGLSDDDDLDVILITESTGSETVLTKTTQYTITGANTNDPQDLTAGGTVTTTAAYSSAYQILLRRATVKTQLANIDDEEVEEALDKLTWIAQDIYEVLGRCLKIQPSESGDTVQFAPDGTAGYAYRGATGNWSLATPSTGTQAVAAPWDSVIAGTADANEAQDARDDIDAERRAMYNVMDYEATGDGVTDDGPAIQAAIDAAPSGSIVFFPPPASSYNVLTPIEPKSYIHYLGGGRRYCLLKADNNNTDAIFKGTGGKFSNTVWTGLCFRSSNADAYAFKATALNAYVDNFTMRDCEFYDEFHTDFYGTLANSTFERTRFGYLGNGPYTVHRHIYSGDETDSKAVFTNTFNGCWFYNAAGAEAAVWFYSGNTLQFNSCIWQACACPALRVEGIRNTWIQNCDFEDVEPNVVSANNCMVEVYADSTAVPGNITFTNCWVQNNGASNGEPWTAWAYLTTSGADAKAVFNQCSGNMGDGYWTKTGSTVDYAQNITVTNSNPVNNSSTFGSSYSIGREPTFWKGMNVRNATASAGFISMYEDADDGENYLTFTAQAMDANETMYPIYTRSIDVNNVEIKALVTPVELVPAPGAGRLIVVEDVSLFLDYSGGALAEPSAPDDLAVEYDDGTGAQIVTWDSTGFITATADAISVIQPGTVGAGAGTVTSAANVNKNVVLINTGGNYTGAGSTSVIRVIVQYRILENLGL